jgi:uncharacterized NAD(P)/FAD-binding protein YdhS
MWERFPGPREAPASFFCSIAPKCPSPGVTYSTARRDSFAELKGTRARIVVPRCGCDSIENVQHFQSLLHADEAKPLARLCGLAVKAHARIANREMNLTGRSPQSHFEVPNPTVFGRIAEGFLQNSEEAKRHVRRQSVRQIVNSEINFHFLLLPKFLTEASHLVAQQ